MKIHEWCIAVLKGRRSNVRFTEIYNLCSKYYKEAIFNSEEELLAALETFKDFFLFEDFKYDYVTFEDDGQIDTPILELAKDVLLLHDNHYSMEVLCRKMNDYEKDVVLDEITLKNFLSERKCFTIESRSITWFKLSPQGEAYNIEPLCFRRPAKSEEQKQQEAEQKRLKMMAKEPVRLEDLSPRQIKLLKNAIREEEIEKQKKKKQKAEEQKARCRIKRVIAYFQINDDTTVEQLWKYKLIRKEEYTKCVEWSLFTVGDVYKWVKSNRMTERLDYYRKRTAQRMMKIASYHDPELAHLIPNVRFVGIREVNRAIKLSQMDKER